MTDIDRLRRLAGLINEAHVPAAGPNPAASLNAHDCECEEDDCPRCNPATEANNGELDECIEEAYRRFMGESRKKKAEPKWENCPECGGSGMRGSSDGLREFPCHDCNGEGGFMVEPDEDEELNEQGEEEDIPDSAAEAGTGLIEAEGDDAVPVMLTDREREILINALGGLGHVGSSGTDRLALQKKIEAASGQKCPKGGVHNYVPEANTDGQGYCTKCGDDGMVSEGRAERLGGGNVSVTMSVAEANAAAQALNHVGREVFDGEGDGLLLIDLANQIRRCL